MIKCILTALWMILSIFLLYGESPNDIKMKGLVYEFMGVPGSTFQMGKQNGPGSEMPVHTVTISSFYMGKTEVTQGLWKDIMGDNPAKFQKGDNYPVENVSWEDVQEFIRKLNIKTKKKYRLPTEAEWEYSCRADSIGERYGSIDDIAWYFSNVGYGSTFPVGQKKPNALGLYDMLGNVWEWCSDWIAPYPFSPQVNPKGPATGRWRVLRGGNHRDHADKIRTTSRSGNFPSYHDDGVIGFRLASDLD